MLHPEMEGRKDHYSSVSSLLCQEQPEQPVYCIYPEVYRAAARGFVNGFPGRVLYAVKANDQPEVLRLLHAGGVRHFDCASLHEVELVNRECGPVTSGVCCYFMVPVRLRHAAREAFGRYGVRHFMIDHEEGIGLLQAEVDLEQCVVFVRMAVHHAAALQDLSSKFGAPPGEVPRLIKALAALGAEPALAFNVGSSVVSTAAYTYSINVAAGVLDELPFPVSLVDIGGGFPQAYPGFPVPPLADYFFAIAGATGQLRLAPGGELMAEPGRALAAPGLSAVVEVLLRKRERLYLNDGMYGIFWELRFKGHKRLPVRVFREGCLLHGEMRPFHLYGPTCDASDVLPETIDLPNGVRTGDYLEFGCIGAYSLSGRSRFNGFFSDRIVTLTGQDAQPPA